MLEALAGNEAGLDVLGYCNQARFLINCGLLTQMEAADLPTRVMAQKLVMEHEMGELFKVIGFYKGEPWQAMGYMHGDKTHTLRCHDNCRTRLCLSHRGPCMIRWLIVVDYFSSSFQ